MVGGSSAHANFQVLLRWLVSPIKLLVIYRPVFQFEAFSKWGLPEALQTQLNQFCNAEG